MCIPEKHRVLGTSLTEVPSNLQVAIFGLGCFWGAERRFWKTQGVWSTAVGYLGGELEHPSYKEVCSTYTNHAEVVRIVFDPKQISYAQLLSLFWEMHDPTQGMRQGNDVGTQYRSLIAATTPAQYEEAKQSQAFYQSLLLEGGKGKITTEILSPSQPFYYAESEHQQYLDQNPNGYCALKGTGIACDWNLK